MGAVAEKFEEALSNRLKKLLAKQQFVAVVKELNQDEYTCDVEPVDGGPIYHNVRYKTTIDDDDQGIIITPLKNSFVICSILDNEENGVIVSKITKFEEIEITTEDGFKCHLNGKKLTINGDNFGGLVKAPELKKQVDKNSAILDAILQVFQTTVNEAGNGAPSSFQAALLVATTGKQTADLSDIENKTIKHGNG